MDKSPRRQVIRRLLRVIKRNSYEMKTCKEVEKATCYENAGEIEKHENTCFAFSCLKSYKLFSVQ